jgi:DNA repair protein RadA/Sms
MVKIESSFVCQECGYESPKFLGKCPECGEWNSLKEIKISNAKIQSYGFSSKTENIQIHTLSEIKHDEKNRIFTGFSEMDNVLGGGVVKGSVILLAGDPGIGKSTLLLQTALNLSNKKLKVLYVSGEESEQQIKMRAIRLALRQTIKENKNLFLVSLTNTDQIANLILDNKPDFVIVDSIQTVESENLTGLSGSVGQVRYAAAEFIKVAKTLDIPEILVGHVTKEGMVAGPMILSHMVDTVLFLEGEKNTGVRILRSLKNRFGPIDEVGIFAMGEKGLEEVKNPEGLFIGKTRGAGSILVANLEGTRTLLVEIQALCVFSKLPMPRRIANGVDYKRLELILAVLHKHARLPVDQMDVFINVAGGLKLTDTACDLGIALAIFSSIKNLNLSKIVAISEIGLLGELRTPPFLEKRIAQAKKLGFTKVISTKNYNTIEDVISSLTRSY